MNVFDYLQWRGDLTFEERELNEVDALIFSWISYYQLEKFRDMGINIKNLSFDELRKKHIEIFGNIKERDILKTIIPCDSAEYLFDKASQTVRFSKVQLLDFEEEFDKEKTIQFAAMTFKINDKISVVAYRGTDASIVGWKEDCQLSYKDKIAGQEAALAYLEKTPKLKSVILCGHSKGGNLALFSLYNIHSDILKKIERTYNFDGPGFINDMAKNGREKELEPVVNSFIPESSIVGMLLDHDENYTIIESKMVSALQHNAMMWQVVGTHFVYCNDISFSSKIVDQTFAIWLKKLSLKEREDFINTLFSILEETKIKNITDIGDDFFLNIQNIIKGLKEINKDQIKMILYVIKEFSLASGKSIITTQTDNLITKMTKNNPILSLMHDHIKK